MSEGPPPAQRGRRPNPFVAGVRARCPQCGHAPVFAGYLTFADRCPTCGLDHGAADVGDGAAVFVIFLVGFIVVPLALVLSVAGLGTVLALALTLPLAVGLTLALLRPMKATLYAVQIANNAAEARLDDPQP